MRESLLEYLENQFKYYFNILPKKILIGLSGGVDSMALAVLAKDLCDKFNIELHTVTINHNLRVNSKSEALLVHNIAKENNIKNKFIEWDRGHNISSNIEANARDARYAILEDYAIVNEIKVILVGHHLDDQIENFYIRLSRGSGIDGLSVMDKYQNRGSYILFRPLLEKTKQEFITYLEYKNIRWVEDESNKENKFLRNKIRNLLSEIEDKEVINKRILRTIEHIKRARDYITIQAETEYNKLCKLVEGKIVIDLISFIKLHPEIAFRILIKVFSAIDKSNKRKYKPRFDRLVDLYDILCKGDEGMKRTFSNCIIEIKNQKLNFYYEY